MAEMALCGDQKFQPKDDLTVTITKSSGLQKHMHTWFNLKFIMLKCLKPDICMFNKDRKTIFFSGF